MINIKNDKWLLIYIAVLLLLIPVNYILFWDSFALSTLVGVVMICLTVPFFKPKLFLTLYTIAAVTGSIGEIVCVQGGVWQYTSPDYFGIPLWLTLYWGTSIIILSRLSLFFSGKSVDFMSENIPEKAYGAAGIVVYIALILILTQFFTELYLILPLLSLVIIAGALYFRGFNRFLIWSLGIMGPTLEIIGVHFGIWHYTKPDFLGIPYWLPLAYSTFGVFILCIQFTVRKKIKM